MVEMVQKMLQRIRIKYFYATKCPTSKKSVSLTFIGSCMLFFFIFIFDFRVCFVSKTLFDSQQITTRNCTNIVQYSCWFNNSVIERDRLVMNICCNKNKFWTNVNKNTVHICFCLPIIWCVVLCVRRILFRVFGCFFFVQPL